MNRNKNAFFNGVRDGIPIALGYFAVAFSLGIVARRAAVARMAARSASVSASGSVEAARASMSES